MVINTTAIMIKIPRYFHISKKPDPLIITSLIAMMNHLAGNTSAKTWKNIGILSKGKRKPDSLPAQRSHDVLCI